MTIHLIAAAIALSLPFFVATARDAIDRRLAPEVFSALAFSLLFFLQDWKTAVIVGVILNTLRWLERGIGARALSTTPLYKQEDSIEVGSLVTLDVGEKVPADGIIMHGAAFVDQVAITGNDQSVERLPDDLLFAGTIIRAGSVKLRVTSTGEETLAGRKRSLFYDVSRVPSPTELRATKASDFSFWIYLLAAMAIWVFFHDNTRLIAFLLVAHPGVITNALSNASALTVSAAAKLGILVKGGDALDRIAETDTLVLDRCGPLTFSEIRVGRLDHDPLVSDAYAWECLAVAERSSNHPVGRELFREAIRRVGHIQGAEAVTELSGRGVIARLGEHEIVVGTAELHRSRNVSFDGAWLTGSTSRLDALTTDTFLALNGQCVARLRIEEHQRADVQSTIENLRRLGLNNVLLFTPDTIRLAAKQAETIGITTYHPSMTTEEKWKLLGRLSQGGKTLFVGDGVENHEVLSRAHAALAIAPDGSFPVGACAFLASDDLSHIPRLIALARAFRTTTRLQFSTAILLAAIGALLAIVGVLKPIAAAGYVFATSLLLHVFTARIDATSVFSKHRSV